MEQLYSATSISDLTNFSIAISEEFGWIEPVFLLISPNLCEVLRLNKEPIYLDQIKHFEIINFQNTYALHFFNSEDTLVNQISSELMIKRANHICRKKHENGKMYSVFEYSHHFTEISQYLEYCFFYKANDTFYLTNFHSFVVDDY